MPLQEAEATERARRLSVEARLERLHQSQRGLVQEAVALALAGVQAGACGKRGRERKRERERERENKRERERERNGETERDRQRERERERERRPAPWRGMAIQWVPSMGDRTHVCFVMCFLDVGHAGAYLWVHQYVIFVYINIGIQM